MIFARFAPRQGKGYARIYRTSGLTALLRTE
jgi:hypothetical protein